MVPEEIRKKISIKSQAVGFDEDQEKDVKVLNRIVRIEEDVWACEG